MLLERPESRQLAPNNLLSVPKTRGTVSLSDRRDSSSYGSSMGMAPSSVASGPARFSIQGIGELPNKINRMRKKSASDLSVFIGILRHGTAMNFTEHESNKIAARSSSMGNLRTTIVKRARRRRDQRSNLQRRIENMSPHHIQNQLKLGKCFEVFCHNFLRLPFLSPANWRC